MWERPNDPAFVERLERGTVGFRLTPTRVVAKRKLSQNRPAEVVETIIAELSGDGPYREPRARRRDAPRARRDGPRAVTGVGDTVGTITVGRGSPDPATRCCPTTGRSTSFLDGRPHRRHRSRRSAAAARRRCSTPTGAWLIPGLWDHHVHVVQWALVAQRAPLGHADVRGARGTDHGRGAGPADGRRVGTGFRDAFWPDAPTLALLDAATGDIPTYLINADVHSVWLNSAALRREGFEPDGTGMLREAPAFEISRRLNDVDPRTRRPARRGDGDGCRGPRRRRARRPRHGVERTSAWARRVGGRLRHAPRRVRDLPGAPRPRDRRGTAHRATRVARRGIRSRARRAAQGHHRRLARHPHRGVLARLPRRPAQPRAAHGRPGDARRADDGGDRRGARRARSTRSATSRTRTRSTRSRSPARPGTIEHAQLVAHADIPRFARLGVGASVQPRARPRRPRPDRHDLGRADRARLPARALARSRGEPAARLGRAGLAARSVGGDRRARSSARATGASRGIRTRRSTPARRWRIDARRVGRAAARLEPGARADLVLCERDPLHARASRAARDAGAGDAARRSAHPPRPDRSPMQRQNPRRDRTGGTLSARRVAEVGSRRRCARRGTSGPSRASP